MSEAMVLSLVTIIAIVIGPILAVQAQTWLERRRENKQRQESLFKTLMATRKERVSFDHVRALNTIDIEFYNNDAVIKAWEKYSTHLHNYPEKREENKIKDWQDTSDNLFVDLLQKIARILGYDFEVDRIKRGVYIPQAHGELRDDQYRLRKALLNIVEGNTSLGVHSVIDKDKIQLQNSMQEALVKILAGDQPIKIEKVNELTKTN